MRFPSIVVCVLLYGMTPIQAADWTHWRGPTLNGVSAEKGLPDEFKVDQAGKDNLVWKAPHGCRSTPIVMGGRVYFNSHTGQGNQEQESVVCLDADSGKLLWQYKFNVFFTDIVSSRVGWTNLTGDPATGNVYCHGTSGLLLGFDKDGKVLWERSLSEAFGRISGYGGRLTSPIVDGDLVIIGMNCAAWGEYGRGGCRFIAFDKKNGDLVWWGSTKFRVLDSFQSSPVVATIGGHRLLLSGGGDGGLHAFKVRTGEKVWSYHFCHGSVNTTPVVEGNLVYCAHGDINPEQVGNMNPQQGRIICVDAGDVKDGKPALKWKVDGIKIKFASPVLHDGRLILNDEDGKLHCIDAKSGQTLWDLKVGGGGNVRCSPVFADGKIFVGDSRGRFYIVKDEGKKKPKRPKALVLVSKDPKTGDPVDAELDGAVAVANGRLFFGTGTETYCVGDPKHVGGGLKPPMGEEGKEGGNGKPAHLQVVPAEVTLPPGGSASFRARLFDDKGNFLREVKAEWSVGPMLPVEAVPSLPPPPKINPPALKGAISDDGKLTLESGIQGQFGNVIAKAEGITGHARVLQAPKLPYKQDFEKVPVGAVPGGFINAQVKFQVREEDGSKVLVKTATNASAIVARANAFFGTPDWTNYTIEADVRGKEVDGALPDMGVVANRYQFFLIGEGQLRLITWEGLLRIDKSISYSWKGGVWYRMKLSVAVDGDKAMIRGKIWQRDDKEPAKWTLEVEDPVGNKSGSASLFAEVPSRTIKPNRPGAEVFFDNVVVSPNKGGEQSRNAPESRDDAEADLRNQPRPSTPAGFNHDGTPRRSAEDSTGRTAEDSTDGGRKLWLAGGGAAAVLLLLVVCLWRR